MTNSNDALRAALEPFAKEAATWWDQLPDDARPWIAEPGNTGGDDAQFTVGDLRRIDQIYKALATPSPVAGGDLREAAAKVAEGNVMSGNDQWSAGHDAAARKIAHAIRSLPLS